MVNSRETRRNSEKRLLAARLRFKHLQLIDTLARTGNILRAASEMGVTQSAASKILLDVERILGVPLFERQARGLAPTAGGIRVTEFAKRALNELNNAAFDAGEMTRGGAGSLRIGAIMGSTPDILPTVLAEIRKQKPLLTIHLTATTSDEIVVMLKERRADVGLCRLTNDLERVDFDLEELFEQEYWMFVEPSHHLAKSKELRIEDLVELSWVMEPSPSPIRQVLERLFATAGVRFPASRIETTSRFATLSLVQHAEMVSILPTTILAQPIRNGEFVRLPIGTLKPDTNYGLVTRKHESLSESALLFAKLVRKQAKR